MKREIPRDADGRRLCEHCLTTPVPPSLGTKPRSYCSRGCRQRAYEARLTGRAVRAAVAAVTAVPAASATSRDVAEVEDAPPATSRDVAEEPPDVPQAPAPPPVRRPLALRAERVRKAFRQPRLPDGTEQG